VAKENPEPAKASEQPEFPVTLAEFLSEIPQAKIETKRGFERLCGNENISGSKLRQDWQKLFDLFKTKPVGKAWADHAKEGRK
jgi:hypothetical protein